MLFHPIKTILMIIGDGNETGVKLTGNFLIHPNSNHLRYNLRQLGGGMLIDALTSAVRQINL